MPELRKWDGDRKLGLKIDFESYTYKDKQREKHRVEESIQKAAEPISVEAHKKQKVDSWSQKKDQKATREVRREKRAARRDVERTKKMNPEELEEKKKLEAMIAQVRKNTSKVEEEFAGFSD